MFFAARKSLYCLLCVAAVGLAAGCTTTFTGGESKKVQENQTIRFAQPLHVSAGVVEIVNQYDPSADPKDVSSLFPTPPDVALRRHAGNRLKASGVGEDILKLVIEDASVHHRVIEPEGGMAQWFRASYQDEYEIKARMRAYVERPSGPQGNHSVLNFRRMLTVPGNASVSEREAKQLQLLEEMVADVDTALIEVLRDRMNLLALPAPE